MALNIKTNKSFFLKLTIVALVFLFLFQPLAPVFANTYTYDYNNRLTSATNTDTGAVTTYTYDTQGQRIKAVVKNPDGSLETTLTPFKTYSVSYTTDAKGNKSPEKITKYINTNGTLIATINGAGPAAVVQPVLTDHQGSTTNVLSQANQPAETIDYYPFGQIRQDITAIGQNPQQKKFLGQDFDTSTGLDYLNARYYNSNIAKFLSEDPAVLTAPEKFLTDPQQLNFYSYARNNPINLSDPSGLETDVMSSPLDFPWGLAAGHSTTIVNPDAGENLYMDYNNACSQITEPTTFAGYAPVIDGKWRLVDEINRPDAISTYNKAKETGLPHVAIVSVDAQREGMTNQQLDQKNLNNMVAMQGDQGPYNPFGERVWSTNSNCHNVTTTLLERSGVSQQQVNEIKNELISATGKSLPGFGNSFSTPSVKQVVGQQISNTWNSIKQTFSNIISKIEH